MEQKQTLLFIIAFAGFCAMAASSSIPATFSDKYSGKLKRILSELLHFDRNNIDLLPEKQESLERFPVEKNGYEDLKNAWNKNIVREKERRLEDVTQKKKSILGKKMKKISMRHYIDSTQRDAMVGRPPCRCRTSSGRCFWMRCGRQFSDKFGSAFEVSCCSYICYFSYQTGQSNEKV